MMKKQMMNKQMDIDDVLYELDQMKNLLFFMRESFNRISDTAFQYRRNEENSEKWLAIETNRCIDQLQTLHAILSEKASRLEAGFEQRG